MPTRTVFDGRTLTLYGSDGTVVGSWPAISGMPGHQKPSEQNQSNEGPLTEGGYHFFTDDIQPIDTVNAAIGLVPPKIKKVGGFPGSVFAWGTERVPLTPDTSSANGRGNFFIHGGVTPGSAGCIDLGPNEKAYFDALRSTGESSHGLIVQYDPSLETSPHPEALNSVWKDARQYWTREIPSYFSAFQDGHKNVPTIPPSSVEKRTVSPSPTSWPINQDGQPDETVKPVRYLTRRIVNAPDATGGASDDVWSPPLAPIPSQGPLTLKQAARAWAASQYPQLAFGDPVSANAPAQGVHGPTSPMQPLMPPTLPWQTSPNLPVDLGGWVTGLAGVDPQAPDQPARSPLDEWLNQYVRQNMSAR